MTPLELVQLPVLMVLTRGSEDIVVALLDGPVALDHSDLLSERIHAIPGGMSGSLLVRPIFPETMAEGELLPSSTAQQLAAAMSSRYPAIYERTAQSHSAESSLTGVEVRPSRLGGSTRKIADVVFSYTPRRTNVTEGTRAMSTVDPWVIGAATVVVLRIYIVNVADTSRRGNLHGSRSGLIGSQGEMQWQN
jgi:hypothetical protein